MYWLMFYWFLLSSVNELCMGRYERMTWDCSSTVYHCLARLSKHCQYRHTLLIDSNGPR